MPGTLTGKVALVTGGASGIGRATALTFAREGAKLVIADMNADGGQQTVHMITENGGEATFVRVDVSNATEVEAMIGTAVEIYGRLDCAHNNAGVTQHAYPPTAEFPEDDWHRVLAINLTGVWLCMKYELSLELFGHTTAAIASTRCLCNRLDPSDSGDGLGIDFSPGGSLQVLIQATAAHLEHRAQDGNGPHALMRSDKGIPQLDPLAQ